MNSDTISSAISTYSQLAIDYLPKILMALLVLFIGFRIIKYIVGVVKGMMTSRDYDVAVVGFLSSVLSALLKVALILAVLGMLGINTTSFVAIVGAMGLAVGLALQGNLANFASGVMVLIFKPYRLGDYVKVNGIEGFVRAIDIFTTTVVSADEITHHVPNGAITSGNITNVSQQGKIRLHIPAGISYDADIKHARNVLLGVAKAEPKVLTDPAPAAIVAELGESSVNMDLMVWCAPSDVPYVTATMNEGVKIALDDAGIEIPYPHEVSINK